MKLNLAIEEFIEHKRNDGYVYHTAGGELRSFGRRLGNLELRVISATQILDFLNDTRNSPYTWRRKYGQLARFFRYWQVRGEIATIRMPAPRGMVRQTFTPYVYSRTEVHALLQATNEVRMPASSTIQAESYRTFLLLLYATGIRVSEAASLLAADVDLEERTLCVRAHGTGTLRKLPIGSDLSRALNRYSKWKKSMHLEGKFFLLRRDGRGLNKDSVYGLFRKLLLHACITRRDHVPYRPRTCDLRVTFAVHRITSWIRRGRDLNRLLPALAGYLGYADLNATERFLALTPGRFKIELDKLSPNRGTGWVRDLELMEYLDTL